MTRLYMSILIGAGLLGMATLTFSINPTPTSTEQYSTNTDAINQEESGESPPRATITFDRETSDDVSALDSAVGGVSSELLTSDSFAQIERSTAPHSKIQEELYTYGNDLGVILGAFASSHEDLTQILGNHAMKREDPSAKKAVIRIADDYVELSRRVALIEAPSGTKSLNTSIAASYKALSEKIRAIGSSSSDEVFLAAIYAHNESAGVLVQNLISLSTLFTLQDVHFSSSDAGRIFMPEMMGM